MVDLQIVEKQPHRPSTASSFVNQSLYGSMGCLMSIAEFLTYHELLQLQCCGKKLYRDIVPRVMMNRQYLPQIGLYHFFNQTQSETSDFQKKSLPYDPKVIFNALKKESSQYFVPKKWPGSSFQSQANRQFSSKKLQLTFQDIYSNTKSPSSINNAAQQPHHLGHYSGQSLLLREKMYPHGCGSLYSHRTHRKGTSELVEMQRQPEQEEEEGNGAGRAQINETETYHGQFWMGKRHGIGRLEKSNGEIYIGEWDNDKPRGKGIMIGKQNEQVFYVGEFFDGLYQGQGSLYDLDDYISEENLKYQLYRGSWYAGLKHGPGFKITAKVIILLEDEEFEKDDSFMINDSLHDIPAKDQRFNRRSSSPIFSQRPSTSSMIDTTAGSSGANVDPSPENNHYGHWQPFRGSASLLKTAMDQDEEDEVNQDDDKLAIAKQSKSYTRQIKNRQKRKVEKQKIVIKEDKQRYNYGKLMD